MFSKLLLRHTVMLDSPFPHIEVTKWLETNVGKARWTWDWDLTPSRRDESLASYKFRFIRKKDAILFALRWS